MFRGGELSNSADVVVFELVAEYQAVDEAGPDPAINESGKWPVAFGDNLQDVGVKFGLTVVIGAINPNKFIISIGNALIGPAAKRPPMDLMGWA